MTRSTVFERSTNETTISGSIDIDGTGAAEVDTGLGFLDHMIQTLAKHSRIDLELSVSGDTHIDDHHTVEDVAIVVGRALDEVLGDRAGITRFGHSYAPLDEALCRAVVDLSGRGWAEVLLPIPREKIGDVASENLRHFLTSLATEGRMTLHVDLIRGENSHHIAESAFKALALALGSAIRVSVDGILSTKGTLR
jgi:imidazoleglycerol-phosphate dehydratase